MIPLARPLIGDEERVAVDRVMASGRIAQGPEVAAFEEEFSALVNGRHCVAVNSGTAALHLGMLAAEVGPGDEVIVPSFSFAASANAIRLCGASPVFIDIVPGTYCLDPAAVEAATTPRTVAIMPVHLFGHPAPMVELSAIAARRGLLLVEDAAQAHGASLHGRGVGTWGTVAAFSFYPTKNMTTGEGGMVVTADPTVARTVRLLRNHGMERHYHNEIVGFNARMTDLAAAIGRAQLDKLQGWNKSRRDNAAQFDGRLRSVAVPPVAAGAVHVYHQYTVRSADRAALLERLSAKGVGAAVHYPVPIHRLPSFRLELELPETERAAAEVLSLPVRPDLTAGEIDAIVEAVNA